MERVDSADSVLVESDLWEDCDRTDSSRGEDNLQEAKTAIYVETANSQVRVASGEQRVSWSAQNPSHVSAVKSRSPWSRKRTHKRIDGLRHLSLASVVDGNLQKQIQPLHGIVFCLVRLDLWTLMAAIKVSDGSSHNLHSNEYEDIEELLPEYETSTWFGKEYYAGLHPQEEAIMKYVQGFSKVQAIRRIQDVKTLPYLPRMLDVEITTYQVAKAAREFAESSPKFALPQKAKKTGGKIGKADYIELCVRKSREARYLLQTVYRIALELRGHIAKAFSEALLDDISLDSLQAKMSALQEHFTEVSIELGKPPQDLIWGSPSWWQRPQAEEPDSQFFNCEPKHIATAFPIYSNTKSTLSFLVPVLSISSCIPVALAWTKSTHQIGLVSDADFYQLISNSSMQLLGTLTLIIPTLLNARIVRQAWFWTWVLAAASTACSIVAIPLYLNAPTEWSAVISFAGNVMQAFVTLQLMFVI